MDYIPALVSLIGALITTFFTYKASQSKNSIERKQADASAEAVFRDDMLKALETYDKKFASQDARIILLQEEVYKLKGENLQLLKENLELRARVKSLEGELTLFENKVFYKKDRPQ